jgi:hypothetical protein
MQWREVGLGEFITETNVDGFAVLIIVNATHAFARVIRSGVLMANPSMTLGGYTRDEAAYWLMRTGLAQARLAWSALVPA